MDSLAKISTIATRSAASRYPAMNRGAETHGCVVSSVGRI